MRCPRNWIRVTHKIYKPKGILQENAADLRIGAMAFNKVGSWSECPPQTSLSDDNVEQYCLADNLDGARLIAPIRSGKWVVVRRDDRR